MALESNGHMNADGPVVVTVNQRALVDKVLARYPEDFTGGYTRLLHVLA